MPVFALELSSHFQYTSGKMTRTLETEIRGLQRELAGVEKEQALLRFQPCRGDSEIRKKEANLEELERRAQILNETLQDLTRKRQLLISQCTTRGIYDSLNLQQNSSDVSGNQDTGEDHGQDAGGKSG
jgi:chromosome segregation ATPase